MARLTRNSYKRKIILFAVFVFISIALISTGFAAWVMSNDATLDANGFAGKSGEKGITTATYGDHAAEFLAKMYSHFSGKNYVIVITAEPYNEPVSE